MVIINQPFQGQLGNILIEQIKNHYDTFIIFSAFAKNSGVLRMKPAMETFRSVGGKIIAFIGIDLDGTSYEALLNLDQICDELYVIHSENFSTTYHSKIYLLSNKEKTWCAVGSNNFTGGGLWTNFESCAICEYDNENDAEELDNIKKIVRKYMECDYQGSAQITDASDIEKLLSCNYISKEVSQKVENTTRRVKEQKKRSNVPMFGSEKVSIPAVVRVEKALESKLTGKAVPVEYAVVQSHGKSPAFTNEQFWFEMRESTGGSRNILDLSKVGKIEQGDVTGTPYELEDTSKMYGGIKFFEIDPEDTSATKDITINYQGKDYFPSTIKFAPNNGSWRIQLKGSPDDGSEELSRYGNQGVFIHKILVFEKISTDYYVLSLLDESELDHIKEISRVWARNGSSRKSKAYGML